MNRRMMGQTVMEEVPDDLSLGAEGTIGADPMGGSPPNPDPNSGNPPTGSETPFADGPLKGLTQTQAAERMRVLEATSNAQREQLENVRRQGNPAPAAVPVVKEEARTPTAAEFWTAPVENIESVVTRTMEKIITPFREDLARSRANESWDEVARKFPDFATYEPLVRTMVQNNGVSNPNAALLETFYYTALGYTARHGNPNGQPTGQSEDRPPPRGAPPQHRASNQPVPSGPAKTEYELTEEDRTVMRRFGFSSKEEFMAYKNSDETTVLTAWDPTPPAKK